MAGWVGRWVVVVLVVCGWWCVDGGGVDGGGRGGPYAQAWWIVATLSRPAACAVPDCESTESPSDSAGVDLTRVQPHRM